MEKERLLRVTLEAVDSDALGRGRKNTAFLLGKFSQ
jgi:hypothetical protein